MRIYLSDLKRALTSWGFFLAILGTCAVYFAGAWVDLKWGTEDVLYYFNISNQIGGYKNILVFLCVLPYAINYSAEWNHSVIRYTIIRSNKTRYAWSKVVATAISGGMALAVGLSLFILILSFKFPMVNTSSENFQIFINYGFGSLLASGNYILYYIFYILQIFFFGAFWAVFALVVSAWITNFFITVSAPFIIFYFFQELFMKMHIPTYLNITRISTGVYRLSESAYINLMFIAWFLIGLTAIMGFVFASKVKRRISNA